jgi:hypothetical protein
VKLYLGPQPGAEWRTRMWGESDTEFREYIRLKTGRDVFLRPSWCSWRKRVGLLDVKTGRITCEVCATTIGQVDNHNSAEGILELNHFAPCGLPCACEGADPKWQAANCQPGALGLLHAGAERCSICSSKPCPICNGTGRQERDSTPPRKYARCTRCDGVGKVDGLSLHLEQQENA